ncbi:MAG: hypothetical protein ABJE95_31355 [Byssovorax sp.]
MFAERALALRARSNLRVESRRDLSRRPPTMPALPSKIVLGTLETAPPGMPLLFPFGDRDDPQRLAVLLAEQAAAAFPASVEIGRKARVCLDPRTSWKDRRILLGDTLALAAEQSTGHFLALADIDALAPAGTEDWSADRSITMRHDLYKLVLEAVERGGWLVFRTSPTRRVSPDLADLDLEETYATSPHSVALPEEANPYAPEIRPIAAWLTQRGALRPRDLSRIVADVEDFDAHLVDLAYDALSPSAVDAGKLLSAVRPPQHVNGAMGPFAYSGARPTATSIPRAAADALRASGFLQPLADPSTLRMPRLARDQLRRFAHLGMAGETRQLHAHLAALPLDAQGTSDKLETHHHAVLARDVERAKSTALFYGTELRDLATQLSREAHVERDRAKFKKAADLFEYIVTTFDKTDAYAWEYLGYNLARADDLTNRPRIRQAYETAHRLWPDNPLYHGRLLGFRGQLGQDIVADFTLSLDRYVTKFGAERDAVSFFAEAAFKGLERGKRADQVNRIVAQKRALLDRFAPRALAAVTDDE